MLASLGLAIAREDHQGVYARLAGYAVDALMGLDPTYQIFVNPTSCRRRVQPQPHL
jgi:hypothetical protein